jgi:PPP family 3-phenylpropionic acid transporter
MFTAFRNRAPLKPGVTAGSLVVLKWFHFFVYGTISILFTFFPLYFVEKGLSKLEIGMLMAGGPLISVFANPFWGYWSDKYQNIRRTIVLMLAGNLLVVQAVFFTDTYAVLYVVMLVFFLFQTPLFSQTNSLVLNSIEGTSYKFGEFRLWGSIGWAVMAVAAAPVVAAIGVNRLWAVYSSMLLLSLCFTVGMPKGGASFPSGSFSGRGYRQVFGNRLFLSFVILGILISVPNSMNSTFVSLYIQDLGGAEVLIGWSAFLTAIFEVPVFLLFDRFMKKDTRYMIACLAAISLLFSVRWLLMSMASEPWHVLCIQVLHSVTFGGYYYIGTSLTAHLVPSQYRASGQAAFALTWSGVSGVAAGFIGGWMYESLGTEWMYRINTVIALGAMAGFGVMLNGLRRKAAHAAPAEQAAD